MKRISILLLAVLFSGMASAKCIKKLINKKEVFRIENTLSHDSMEGRKSFTPGIEKAATFIANEMKNAGLQPFGNGNGYMHPFEVLSSSMSEALVNMNGKVDADIKNIHCISGSPQISITENSHYKIIRVNAGDNYADLVRPILNSTENILVFIDSSFASQFSRLSRFTKAYLAQPFNIVFVLTPHADATQFSIDVTQKIQKQTSSNLVGYLPGKSKPNEYVIFSGHYDHMGYGRPDSTGDSLYNGANDDASGVTAMLMLAKYYKAKNNNQRSLLFIAFSAEELGGFGSKVFSNAINPLEVAAMFNIEMIGTDSKWGNNSAFITGYEKSDMGKILEKNLKRSKFKFYPDPYTNMELFYRSDNATLARLGVPAHTISTSKMDNEPHYHKASDEIGTLDIPNMTEVIKAIALSAKTIVAGIDTPSRIERENLE